MSKHNRTKLKEYFEKGNVPKEEHFFDLIDSMVNIVDEGFDKTLDKGLALSPPNSNGYVASIYRNMEDNESRWSIRLEEGTEDLTFRQIDGNSVLAITQDEKIGVGTLHPEYQLHTTKTAGLYGRAGTFSSGEVLADRKWHAITKPLTGCYALEVMAGFGTRNSRKYALLMANAVQCFGKKRRIKRLQSWRGFWFRQIRIRWRNTKEGLVLQIRSRHNLSESTSISYNVSSLWDNPLMEKEVVK